MRIIVSVLITIFTISPVFASSDQCKNFCRNERIAQIKKCIIEEGEYWKDISKAELEKNCRFLTYPSYRACLYNCSSSFKKMNYPKILDNGEIIPEQKSDIDLKYFIDTFLNIITLFIILGIYITPTVVVAYAAKLKGYERWIWFGVFSAIFTPLLGFLAVIAFPSKIPRRITLIK